MKCCSRTIGVAAGLPKRRQAKRVPFASTNRVGAVLCVSFVRSRVDERAASPVAPADGVDWLVIATPMVVFDEQRVLGPAVPSVGGETSVDVEDVAGDV